MVELLLCTNSKILRNVFVDFVKLVKYSNNYLICLIVNVLIKRRQCNKCNYTLCNYKCSKYTF